MKSSPSVLSVLLVIFGLSVVSLLLFSDLGTDHPRMLNEFLNYGHLPLFGALSLGILRLLSNLGRVSSPLRRYAAAGLITALLGVLTEFTQNIFPNREFSLQDICYDAAGAAIFLALAYPYHEGYHGRRITRLAAMALMVVLTLPMIAVFLDTWSLKRDFPLIGSFESYLEMSRWESRESKMERTTTHATDGKYSLLVRLDRGEYTGVSLNHLSPDWSGYDTLSFDVFLAGASPLDLNLRIHDRMHNEVYSDRFNRGFFLLPGATRITIALYEVRKASRTRFMDMTDITNICLFAYRLGKPQDIYLDNFRLNRIHPKNG